MVKLRIRLRVQGVRNNKTYRIVVAESTLKRDGKYIAYIGFYNPRHPSKDRQLFINNKALETWINKGAKMTEAVEALFKQWKKKGIAV